MEEANQAYDIMINFRKVQMELKSRIGNHFKSMDLTAPQGMLVYILNQQGPLKITELSDKMGLSNSTVSGIVDRLESQGYVIRERSKDDRRVVNVSITGEMKHRLMSHENLIEQIMKETLNKADEEELKAIADGFAILGRLLTQ